MAADQRVAVWQGLAEFVSDYCLIKARSHRPKHKDCVWIANKFRLLREFNAIAGFERFKALLRLQIDVLLRGLACF